MSFTEEEKEKICQEYWLIHQLLEMHYGWNEEERMAWLNHPNHLVNNIKPMTMIQFGQTKDLIRMLDNYIVEHDIPKRDKTT